MPELVFKGKECVYNHHLTVPYRPLVPDRKKSIGPADLGGNLIIHGDNLHALKTPAAALRRQGRPGLHRPALQHRQRKLELQRQRQLADHARVAEVESRQRSTRGTSPVVDSPYE